MSGSRAWASIPKASAPHPAIEKAAPIPAEVEKLANDLLAIANASVRADGSDIPLGETCRKATLVLADRADRQEERIREDEPLPERLRKSYEKGAQDERDRLYKAGLKWPRDVCDFLEIEGAKVRARQRGDAS